MRLVVDAVLFDNDGVLVDSHDQVVTAWTALAEEFGLEIDVLLEELVGRRAADTLASHVRPDRLDDVVDRLEQLEVDLAASTPALAGAVGLIDQLPHGTWTIATSASRRLAQARWVGAGIPVPLHSVTADDVANGKPHPEPYVAAARLLGVDPGRCVVFEDSSAGGRAAVSAGTVAVAVGDAEWDLEPTARVTDLRSVAVVSTTGAITLDLQA